MSDRGIKSGGAFEGQAQQLNLGSSNIVYLESFKGCWAKIARAKKHRDELSAYIDATFAPEENRPQWSVKFDDTTAEHVFYVSKIPELVDFFETVAVSVGDVIHNLRSALDYLTFQLALIHTNGMIQDERQIQFPISDSVEEFQRAVRRSLKEIASGHVAIIESVQPYHGTAGRPDGWSGPYLHQLTLLRDLNNADKHRLLTTILAGPWQFSFRTSYRAADILAEALRRGGLANVLELGSEIARVWVTHPLRYEEQSAGWIRPMVNFPEGRPVIPTLDRITDFVIYVIRQFDRS